MNRSNTLPLLFVYSSKIRANRGKPIDLFRENSVPQDLNAWLLVSPLGRPIKPDNSPGFSRGYCALAVFLPVAALTAFGSFRSLK